jgi:hypothetical protein
MFPEYPHQASKLFDDQGISQMDQAPAREGHSRLGAPRVITQLGSD